MNVSTTELPAFQPKRQESKPRRRFFQFSLRTFLIAVLLISFWMGWYCYRAEQQRRGVKTLLAGGASVRYDFELTKGRIPLKDSRPLAPKWLVNAMGVDYFAIVREVTFDSEKQDLTELSGLRGVTSLTIRGKSKLKSSELAKFRYLNRLQIDRQVPDFSALATLPNLEYLMIFSEKLDDVGPLAKFSKLKRLAIDSKNVKDLSPLSRLTQLKSLNLLIMSGRDAEFDLLTKQLPNCQVIRQDRPAPIVTGRIPSPK